MQPTIDDLYINIQDLMTRTKFKKEINKYYSKWNKLIDKNIIALYLVDKLGRNQKALNKISEMKSNQEYSLITTIQHISKERTFKRKNGSEGQVINIGIKDDTGSSRLVLWNNDINFITEHKITPGTIIKIINGYTKQAYGGIEIHLGKWGILEILDMHSSKNQKEDQQKTLTGILTNRTPTQPFFKDNGDFGFMTKISIQLKQKKQQIILWNEMAKEIQQFAIGDVITIQNYSQKQYNGNTELHLDGQGIICKG